MNHKSNEDELLARFLQMSTSYARSVELFTFIRLGLPDLLFNTSLTLEKISEELKVDKRSLYRFLRLMVTRGFLIENNFQYELTPFGSILRSDHPSAAHNIMLYIGEIQIRVGLEMMYSVQTGKPAFDKIFGMPFFEYLTANPEMGRNFNDAMKFNATSRMQGLLSNYDFGSYKKVVDVGGGNGTLIINILKKYPHIIGIVFETSVVAVEAKQNLEKNNLLGRGSITTGDFFCDPIPPAEIYILSNIIHDWPDEKAREILTNCQKSMLSSSRMLLIEQIMPDDVVEGSAAIGSDMGMMVLTGGVERTRGEYDALLRITGLSIKRVIPFIPANVPIGRVSSWAIIETEKISIQ